MPAILVNEASNRDIDLREALDAGIRYRIAEREQLRLHLLYVLKVRRDKSGQMAAMAFALALPWVISRMTSRA